MSIFTKEKFPLRLLADLSKKEKPKKRKNGFYRAVLNTCPSFLNEVMASEPLFEERSDAAKVCETLCLG